MTEERATAATEGQDAIGRWTLTEGSREMPALVVETSARLIKQRGYRRTTVAKIAKELDMSPASVYRFYSSKDELRHAVCQRVLDDCHNSALGASGLADAAAARLRLFVETQHSLMVNMIGQDPWTHELILSGIDKGWDAIGRFIERGRNLVAEIILDGVSSGAFADQDPDAASRSFAAATAPLWHPRLVAHGLGKRNQARPEDLIDFVLRALR